jgi:hypothetical protein
MERYCITSHWHHYSVAMVLAISVCLVKAKWDHGPEAMGLAQGGSMNIMV